MIHRRTMLIGLIAAPAIVRASSLMPIKSILGLNRKIVHVDVSGLITPTLDINGAPHGIVWPDGSVLAPGNLEEGDIITLQFANRTWEIVAVHPVQFQLPQ